MAGRIHAAGTASRHQGGPVFIAFAGKRGSIRLATEVMRFGIGFIALVLALSAFGTARAVSSMPAAPLVARYSNDLWHREHATGDWWGRRTQLANEGVTIGADWVLEGFDNFLGGKHTGITGASTFDLSATVETDKLLGLPGGEFYVDMEDHRGRDPSIALTGDLQVFDKLNDRPYLEVFELWYQQKFFHDKLRVKIGKVDGNSEFAVVRNGLDFINSSSQLTPTLYVLPTTPAPMASVNVFYRFNRMLYLGLGVYNANHGDNYMVITGTPQNAQPTSGGALFIGEGGLLWDHLPGLRTTGEFQLGVWGHTGKFKKFDGGSQYDTGGIYLILDQTLWEPTPGTDDSRGLRGFLEYGHTERSVATIYQHVGGGLAWTGLFRSRPKDVTGLGAQCGFPSPEAGFTRSYELAVETFYKVQLTPWLFIQPDLQYIVNAGARYPNALVGTIRAKISF